MRNVIEETNTLLNIIINDTEEMISENQLLFILFFMVLLTYLTKIVGEMIIDKDDKDNRDNDNIVHLLDKLMSKDVTTGLSQYDNEEQEARLSQLQQLLLCKIEEANTAERKARRTGIRPNGNNFSSVEAVAEVYKNNI